MHLLYKFPNRSWAAYFFCVLVVFSSPSIAETAIRFQLTGAPQFRNAGYYVAEAKGFYQEAGINLTLSHSNSSQNDLIDLVSKRDIDFSIGNASLALAALQDKPIVVVATIFQRTSGVMITKVDFGNKFFTSTNRGIFLPSPIEAPGIYALLTSQGILFSEALKMAGKGNDLVEFESGKIDAFFGHLFREPLVLDVKKIPYRIIDPVNYGIHFYGDTLFANRDWVNNNIELTNRFVLATLKGWQYALDNPSEAISIIKKQPGAIYSDFELEQEAKIINELILPKNIDLGRTDISRWHLIADFFRRTNLAKSDAQLPKDFLFQNRREIPKYNYHLILELAIIGLVILIGIFLYFFYPRFNRLQKTIKEKDILVREAQARANEDPLTGLPNRRFLVEQLRKAILKYEQESQTFALCFMDIDNFKIINDLHGHDAGDAILVELSRRMRSFMEPSESLTRHGGDEFVLILVDVNTDHDVLIRLKALRVIIEISLRVQDKEVNVSVSFGYAIFKSDGQTVEELFKVADRRMYRDKLRNIEHS